jgi:hypothetical protein
MTRPTVKIGDVDDVLIDKEGRVTAMIIGVGGFNATRAASEAAPAPSALG